MSAQDTAQLLMLKGAISELSAEEQAKVKECHAKLKAIVEEYGELGPAALALLGATIAAED